MDLNLETFGKLELLAWFLASAISVLTAGHVLILLGLFAVIRLCYIKFKASRLGFVHPENKTILVTGCDSGFGLALAKRLQQKGAAVIATCLSLKSDGAKELKESGGNIQVVELDVGKDESVMKCLKFVKSRCSNTGLWGLVNNAGMNYMGDCELSTMTQYLEVANVNLFGMVRTCKAFLPLLRQAKGRVVNVTSVKGVYGMPSSANYTITKFGGEAFSDILRQEMAQFGVKVVILEPGNFGGATGCLNEAGLQRMKRLLDEMWEEASPEAKDFYGKFHLEKQLTDAENIAATTYPTLDPVLNAFEDALFNPCPNIRYLVPGSNSYVDTHTLLARMMPYLPETVFEKLRMFFLPYVIHKDK